MGHLLATRCFSLYLFRCSEIAKNSSRVSAVLDKRKALIDGNDFLKIGQDDTARKISLSLFVSLKGIDMKISSKKATTHPDLYGRHTHTHTRNVVH